MNKRRLIHTAVSGLTLLIVHFANSNVAFAQQIRKPNPGSTEKINLQITTRAQQAQVAKSDHVYNFWVGEQVKLSVMEGNLPAIGGSRWDLGDSDVTSQKMFKDYKLSNSQSANMDAPELVTSLILGLDNDVIEFYVCDRLTDHTISMSKTIDQGRVVTRKARIRVRRPSAPIHNEILVNTAQGGTQRPYFFLQDDGGLVLRHAGIVLWADKQGEWPQGPEGKMKWIQVINEYTNSFFTDVEDSEPIPQSQLGESWHHALDRYNPYPQSKARADSIGISGPLTSQMIYPTGGSAASTDMLLNDQPGSGGYPSSNPTWKKLGVRHKFTTYLMFKSERPDSKWVPLGTIDWGWSAVGKLNSGNTLNLSFTFDPMLAPVDPSEISLDDFPTWNKVRDQYHP